MPSSIFTNESTMIEDSFSSCDIEDRLITVQSSICKVLRTLILKNELNKKKKMGEGALFSVQNIPQISIEEYLKRICFYGEIEKGTLISSIIYIDRFLSSVPFCLSLSNVHQILFISIIVSIKFHEDNHYKLDFYSKVSGITMKKIAKLEYFFLKSIGFNLYINENSYSRYESLLQSF